MNTDSEKLARLLVYMQELYTETTSAWEQLGIPAFNLKKTGIEQVKYGNELYNKILMYVIFLDKSMLTFKAEAAQGCGVVRTRVKSIGSVDEKIRVYTERANEVGGFPIGKCLNDLFGARIILEGELTTSKIEAIAQNALGKKCKVLPRNVGDYRATHVYFHSGNTNYDWELQVWNAADEQRNLESHKKYKQRYTNWRKDMDREGGTTDGETLYFVEQLVQRLRANRDRHY